MENSNSNADVEMKLSSVSN